jgi:hypothetical protein
MAMPYTINPEEKAPSKKYLMPASSDSGRGAAKLEST